MSRSLVIQRVGILDTSPLLRPTTSLSPARRGTLAGVLPSPEGQEKMSIHLRKPPG